MRPHFFLSPLLLICIIALSCDAGNERAEKKDELYKDNLVRVSSHLVVSRGIKGFSIDKETQTMEIGGRVFEGVLGLAPYYKKVGDEVFFITHDATGTKRIRYTLHVYQCEKNKFLEYGPFNLTFKFKPAGENNVVINADFIELRDSNSYRTNYYKIDRQGNTIVENREELKPDSTVK